jgi:hypothetical protein
MAAMNEQGRLAALSAAERLVLGRLVRWFLDNSPAVRRATTKYGPEAAVFVAAEWAWLTLVVVAAVVAWVAVLAGAATVAWIALAVVFVCGLVMVARATAASDAGRLWRSQQPPPSE